MAVRGEWFTENGGGAIPGNGGFSRRHPINQAAEEDDGVMTETVGRSNRRRIEGIFWSPGLQLAIDLKGDALSRKKCKEGLQKSAWDSCWDSWRAM
jgi:hypothetical protein